MPSCQISVIVPVFNAVDFLPECLASLQAQSFPHFEVIFSDDGSTDGSEALCDCYARDYPFASTVHLPNSGPGAARNAALQVARGDYVFFMDADDVILPNGLQRLFNKAKKTGSDLTIGDFMQSTPNGTNLRHERYLAPDDCFFDRSLLLNEVESYLCIPRGASFFTNIWGRLYKLEVIKKHKLAFDQTLKTWEDTVFNFQFLRFAESMSYLHEQLYDYRLHPDKTTCGSQLLNFPFGHRMVLNQIKDLLLGSGCETSKLEAMILHADVYFAVKNLISCYTLHSRGKVPSDFDMKQFVRYYTDDTYLSRALETYVPAENEDTRIPLLLKQGLVEQVELACIEKVQRLRDAK